MRSQPLFILAVLLILASGLCLVIPVHPLINRPEGPTVLGGMGILAAAGALWARRNEAREERDRLQD
jgi:hypothetical protein